MPKKFTDIQIRKILESWTYDSDHGLVWARDGSSGVKSGETVGRSVKKTGHATVVLRIDGRHKSFVLARVIYFLFTGDNTEMEIDHIDRNPHNNKIENLRPCTRSQNNANRVCTGVWQDKRTNKCHVQVQKEGKVHGRYGFPTYEEAKSVRDNLHVELFESYSGVV